MIVRLSFSHSAMENGQAGAKFKAYEYGRKRSLFSQFIPYTNIQASLDDFPFTAENEFGVFKFQKNSKEGKQIQCEVLSREFQKAIASAPVTPEATPTGALNFRTTGAEKVSTAIFTDGAQSCEFDLAKIRSLLEKGKGDNSNPCKTEFYVAAYNNVAGIFVSGPELLKAEALLSENPDNILAAEEQPATPSRTQASCKKYQSLVVANVVYHSGHAWALFSESDETGNPAGAIVARIPEEAIRQRLLPVYPSGLQREWKEHEVSEHELIKALRRCKQERENYRLPVPLPART